jgi:hypothetical protein
MVGLIYVRRRQHLDRLKKKMAAMRSRSATPSRQPFMKNGEPPSSNPFIIADSSSPASHITQQHQDFVKSTRRSSTPSPYNKSEIEMGSYNSPLNHLEQNQPPLHSTTNTSSSSSSSPQRQPNNHPLQDSKESYLKLHKPVTRSDIQEAAHYIQYAEAIYGLPLYMLGNFTRGLQHLLCPESCISACRPPIAQTVAESVMTHLGRPGWPFCCISERPPRNRHTDLIAISLDNGLFRSPYMIALDHDMRSVVVAIRGTLSTADVLVDLNCDLATIQIPARIQHGTNEEPLGLGVQNNGMMVQEMISIKTHSGMLMTAGNIRDEIMGLLEELVKNPNGQYYGYKLIVCGHSLGAVSFKQLFFFFFFFLCLCLLAPLV